MEILWVKTKSGYLRWCTIDCILVKYVKLILEGGGQGVEIRGRKAGVEGWGAAGLDQEGCLRGVGALKATGLKP